MGRLLSILKLVPLKDYLYGAAIIALISGGVIVRNHLIDVGEARIRVEDAKLADLQRQHNQDVTDLAALRSSKIGDRYVEVTHAPIPDSPRVVCVKPTPGARELPETAGNSGLPAAAPDHPAADSIDIGPPLDKIGRDADALILALQDEVRILVAAMNGKTSP